MSPIRVGFIGLSTNSKGTSWATKAHLPYLQSEQGKKHYEIVALCNSSIDSAKKSIKEFKLPESTKSYDAPEDLAKDPNVDLIVNATGVELHHGLLMPVVRAGKNVYTELPLASNMEQMKELLETAESKKIKTVFGMQGQTSPVVKVLRQVIDQGKIGKVLSTTWVGFAGMLGDQPMPVGTKYFTDRKAGGNMMTVPFLHCQLSPNFQSRLALLTHSFVELSTTFSTPSANSTRFTPSSAISDLARKSSIRSKTASPSRR